MPVASGITLSRQAVGFSSAFIGTLPPMNGKGYCMGDRSHVKWGIQNYTAYSMGLIELPNVLSFLIIFLGNFGELVL